MRSKLYRTQVRAYSGVGQVSVTAAGTDSYTIEAVSKSGATHVFDIVKASGGAVTRTCAPTGTGACPAAGTW